jgi:Uri superfamily endonuclease
MSGAARQTVSGRATFDREAPLGYHADMTLPDLPATPGAYVLLLTANAPVVLNTPRFGKLTLAAGHYAYVGSAHGPGGLRARVGRHLRAVKPLHWHIDYLTAALPARHVITVVVTDGARLECTWVKRLLALPGASAPAPGFGSSDCRNGCPAHLIRLPDGLKPAKLEEILVVANGPDDHQCAPVDAVQALLDAIGAGDDEAAERVAQSCAGQTALLPALRPLLADAEPDRRWWAVRTLAVIGGEEAGVLLMSRLHDSDEATRCAAALGLGQLQSTAAIPALLAQLGDANGWVRDIAADALAIIGEPALPALVQTLNDGPDGSRVRAAGALRKIVGGALADRQWSDFEPQFRPAIGALFTALNDPNRLVRHNAYEALDRLGLFETVIIPA